MLKLKFLITYIIFFVATSIFAQEKIEFSIEEQEWIKNHPIVRFGYDPNWPPFEMYNNGEYTGVLADYIELIEKSTGIDFIPFPDLTYQKTLEKLHSGEIHIAPMIGMTKERSEYLLYTSMYMDDPQVIVTRKSYKSIKGVSDLKGKVVAQPVRYKRIKRIKDEFPSIKIITTNNVKECLLAVSSGQADAFIGSLGVSSYYINDEGLANLKIASSTHYGNISFQFALTKDREVLKDIIQKTLNKVSKKERDTIRNNWIPLQYKQGVEKRLVRNYIVYGAIAFLLLTLFFYLWNNTLRNQIRIRNKVEKELNLSLDLIKEKNSEKDTLLKEVHHRVKNNLQIVYSMLNMQSRQVDDELARKVLSEGKSRIMAMALIHKVLYESENLNEVNIKEYVNSLIHNISSVYANDKKAVEVCVEAKDILLNLDLAIPLGLILNELLTNSYKHAFVNMDSGSIKISIEKKDELYNFRYKDNGIGLKNEDINGYKTLGMRLVSRLSNQINANAILKSDNGVEVTFNFKLLS